LELTERDIDDIDYDAVLGIDNDSIQNASKVFVSSKQILSECEQILNFRDDNHNAKLWGFRELLSWRLPEHFCSNSNSKQLNKQRVNAAETFSNQINLYRLDFVT
jgi:hypothetical protein